MRIGTAGWAIPASAAADFPGPGSHLARYAARLDAVEINSSFYRPHRPQTYERWAGNVPAGIRFAVKMPKELTHVRRLAEPEPALSRFLSEAGGLGEKLGPLLVQLPPSLSFDAGLADAFFARVRCHFAGSLVCEPRHPAWFAHEADELLSRWQTARAAADPARVPVAAQPGGWPGLSYYRLHGSPRMYYSAYGPAFIETLASRIDDGRGGEVWCVFDNTARGAAWQDALALRRRLVNA